MGKRTIILAAALAAAVILGAGATLAIAGAGWHDRMMQRHHGGVSTAGEAPVNSGDAATVVMRDSRFSPGNLVVARGARVEWKNEDRATHDAVAADGSWKTERLGRGESAALTFDAPGSYTYICTLHRSMKARLTVQ